MVDVSRYAELGDGAHLCLRSFRRDGGVVETPVWFADIDGRLYLRTVRDSGKVKRIRNNPRVQYASCAWDGRVTGPWRDGRAHVIEDTAEKALHADRVMAERYGEFRREMSALMAQLNKPLCYIEITPET